MLATEIRHVDEVRAADINSIFWGVSTRLLMENAGAGIALIVQDFLRDKDKTARIAIVAGSGGKAGDAFVAARHLAFKGHKVRVYLTSKIIRNEDARANFELLKELENAEITQYEPGMVFDEDVIIDGLLGTGVKGEPRGVVAEAIKSINNSKGVKIAIDVPSGVDPETGAVPGVAVKANATGTMAVSKPGLIKAKEYVGKLYVINIGAPVNAFTHVGPGDVAIWFRRKGVKSKKGDGGKVLVISGSKEYIGAPWLSANAAWASGADLVYLAAPEPVLKHRFSPEIIGVSLEGDYLRATHVEAVKNLIEKVDVVVSGPGLGLHEQSREFLRSLLDTVKAYGKPIVLDADALKMVRPEHLEGVKAVLTPHLGEANIMLGEKLENNKQERINAALKLSKGYSSVIILKGFVDVIAAPDGRFKLRAGIGHQDMSCGGTGDVLTGILATAIARANDLFRAACIAAFVNAAAGEYAYLVDGKSSPTNIIKYVPQVLSKPLEFSLSVKELREKA